MKKIELLAGRLRQELREDGRWDVVRRFGVSIDGEEFWIPEGFDHDGSSWPRGVPGPRQRRIMIAGAVHDWACRYATHGEGGRPLSYMEANRLWYHVSLGGKHKDAKANKFWAWVGRIGLFAGCLPTWIRYRKADASAV